MHPPHLPRPVPSARAGCKRMSVQGDWKTDRRGLSPGREKSREKSCSPKHDFRRPERRKLFRVSPRIEPVPRILRFPGVSPCAPQSSPAKPFCCAPIRRVPFRHTPFRPLPQKKSPRQKSPIASPHSILFQFSHQLSQEIPAPAGISFSGLISAKFPSASSAHSSIPSDTIPASLAGFRFVTTMTFLPTISSGE